MHTCPGATAEAGPTSSPRPCRHPEGSPLPAPLADPLYVLTLDNRYLFDGTPRQVFDTMAQVDDFPAWWRWLRDYEIEGGGLHPGGVLRGLVVPPIPYTFHVSIHVDHIEPGSSIRARLRGDLDGDAQVWLVDHPVGCELTIRWDVEMRKPSMRAAAKVARPLLVWGHDHVIEVAVDRFRGALAERVHGTAPSPSRWRRGLTARALRQDG